MDIRLGTLVSDAQAATGTVLIIDAFRAFTTASIPINNGATHIPLVASIEVAHTLKPKGYGAIIMGEVN